MYKIAILGCENSHADNFLKYIKESGNISDIEVVGVYSDEPEACEKLNKRFGVNIAKSYDEFVGKIDGLIITARHGDNHYKYAKPYIKSGIPMFIDKPITICEKEAIEFMKELKANNVRISGGSSCVHAPYVQLLKNAVADGNFGKVLGGFLRAPLNENEKYGGFYFYSQHYAQIMCEIFGNYPDSVRMFRNDKVITAVTRYPGFDVTGELVSGNYLYYAGVSFENDFFGEANKPSSRCFEIEFENFYSILKGEPQKQTYKEFIAPVFIINAMERSLKSGKEEKIMKIDEI